MNSVVYPSDLKSVEDISDTHSISVESPNNRKRIIQQEISDTHITPRIKSKVKLTLRTPKKSQKSKFAPYVSKSVQKSAARNRKRESPKNFRRELELVKSELDEIANMGQTVTFNNKLREKSSDIYEKVQHLYEKYHSSFNISKKLLDISKKLLDKSVEILNKGDEKAVILVREFAEISGQLSNEISNIIKKNIHHLKTFGAPLAKSAAAVATGHALRYATDSALGYTGDALKSAALSTATNVGSVGNTLLDYAGSALKSTAKGVAICTTIAAVGYMTPFLLRKTIECGKTVKSVVNDMWELYNEKRLSLTPRTKKIKRFSPEKTKVTPLIAKTNLDSVWSHIIPEKSPLKPLKLNPAKRLYIPSSPPTPPPPSQIQHLSSSPSSSPSSQHQLHSISSNISRTHATPSPPPPPPRPQLHSDDESDDLFLYKIGNKGKYLKRIDNNIPEAHSYALQGMTNIKLKNGYTCDFAIYKKGNNTLNNSLLFPSNKLLSIMKDVRCQLPIGTGFPGDTKRTCYIYSQPAINKNMSKFSNILDIDSLTYQELPSYQFPPEHRNLALFDYFFTKQHVVPFINSAKISRKYLPLTNTNVMSLKKNLPSVGVTLAKDNHGNIHIVYHDLHTLEVDDTYIFKLFGISRI